MVSASGSISTESEQLEESKATGRGVGSRASVWQCSYSDTKKRCHGGPACLWLAGSIGVAVQGHESQPQ